MALIIIIIIPFDQSTNLHPSGLKNAVATSDINTCTACLGSGFNPRFCLIRGEVDEWHASFLSRDTIDTIKSKRIQRKNLQHRRRLVMVACFGNSNKQWAKVLKKKNSMHNDILHELGSTILTQGQKQKRTVYWSPLVSLVHTYLVKHTYSFCWRMSSMGVTIKSPTTVVGLLDFYYYHRLGQNVDLD